MDDVEVGQVMTDPVLTVARDDRLDAVADAMVELGIKSVVVVDEECRPAGILTSTDFVRAAADGDRVASGATVEAYMTPEVSTVRPDDSLRTVATRMIEAGIAHLPVVENGSAVGIVSTTDLTAALAGRSESTGASGLDPPAR